MHRKVFWLVIALVVLLSSNLAMAQDKSITIAMTQEPEGFGTLFTMTAGTQVERIINHTSMLDLTDSWEYVPRVALYRPSIEDGTWTVNDEDQTMAVHWKIRDDLYWHDGTQHTIHDWVFGWKVQMDPEIPVPTRMVASKIDRIEVLNDFEAIVYWNELYPFADLMFAGGDPIPRHIMEEVYEQDKEKFVNHPYWSTQYIGTGPYKIKEWVQGSHIELVKNENYPIADPKLDRIFVRFVEDTETLKVMIQTGEVDASIQPTIGFDTAIALSQEVDPDEVHIEFTPGVVWEHIDLNTRDNDALKDVRVRRALLHAIDRQEIVDTVFYGAYEVSHAFLSPRHPLFSEEARERMHTYDYNPERARELLSEAGYELNADGVMQHKETGEELILNFRTTAGNRPRELVQQILAEQWEAIGIKVEIENMTGGALFENTHFYQRQWPGMIMFAWVSYPTTLPDSTWHSKNIPTEENGWMGQNVAGWSNPRADELIDQIINTMSAEKRQELAVGLIEEWTADVPSIPLFFRVDVTTWKTDVEGIRPTGTADPDTWNIHEWDVK